MVNFLFGLLIGHLLGFVLNYSVSKIDKDIKDARE